MRRRFAGVAARVRRGHADRWRRTALIAFAILFAASPRLPPRASLLAQAPAAATRQQTLVKEGLALLDANKTDEARAPLEQARDFAHAAGDVAIEAEARRGLSIVLSAKKNNTGARAELDEALRLFASIQDRRGLGRTYNSLGILAGTEGNWKELHDSFQAAADHFAAAGEPAERARSLRNLTFDRTMTDAARFDVLRQAWEIVHPLDEPRREGLILHQWGDLLTAQGDYGAAAEKLEAAAALLERTGHPDEVSNLAMSLGRAYRLYGLPEQALPYYQRTLAIAQKADDPHGIAQGLTGLSIVSAELGHQGEALDYARRALDQARTSGNRVQVVTQVLVLAERQNEMHRYVDALATLESIRAEAARGLSADEIFYRAALGQAYAGLGRDDEAAIEDDRAVAVSEATNRPVDLMWALECRARLRLLRHDPAGARADSERVIALMERMRATLPPRDLLKQGFGDTTRDAFTLAIDVDVTLNDPAAALVLAEQARGRAFQDLLATREFAGVSETAGATRDGLSSSASVVAPTLDEMKALIARLRAPLVAYWVAPEETFIWVVTPAGRVEVRRSKVEATRLDALARAAATPGKPSDRAGTEWRELYDLLIKPVRDVLQTEPATRLTIVPHGPLFRVSFAALTDERGRYLVDRYELHYAPAAGVLRFTEKNLRHPVGRTALLVADPDLPAEPGTVASASLASARLEVADAARLLGGHPAVLTGGDATEARVRARPRGRDVLHFATHGIVTDRSPLTSYLALARTGSDAAADGKLTAAEIYGLNLSADLVVLSACRSGAGRITGDGIIGLTRGFFYAGAPSVIATLWDVADEPSRYAMRRFYTHWRPGVSKAAALRAAQLDTIRALRAGEIVADTPFGRVTLAERPSLWAAFVLLGEP